MPDGVSELKADCRLDLELVWTFPTVRTDSAPYGCVSSPPLRCLAAAQVLCRRADNLRGREAVE